MSPRDDAYTSEASDEVGIGSMATQALAPRRQNQIVTVDGNEDWIRAPSPTVVYG